MILNYVMRHHVLTNRFSLCTFCAFSRSAKEGVRSFLGREGRRGEACGEEESWERRWGVGT